MLSAYLQAAMRRATYEILEDDGSFYGSIPGFQGVYANAPTLEECREQLLEVLEGWILLGISLHHKLPVVEGINLNKIGQTSRRQKPTARPKLKAA
jgi:predicted RNase H-like HicB family nuclease